MERIVTGIQPTGGGSPHLGNYFGAIAQIPELLENNEGYVMIADVHSTTVDFSPEELRKSSYITYASLVASGVPPHMIFKQSMVPEHFEMSTYLSHFATVGIMERMTQYKDKSQKSKTNDSIGFGLLNYPILMAADILSYNATIIPAGKDQVQHVQLAQELAKKVNNKFDYNFFNIPRIVTTSGNKIMDLQYPEKKMSKSSENKNGVIYIMDELDTAVKKFKRSVTDSNPFITGNFEEQSDGVKNLVTILSLFKNSNINETFETLQGERYSKLKSELIDMFECKIIPIQNTIKDIISNTSVIDKNLIISSERSREVASSVVKLMKHNMGLG